MLEDLAELTRASTMPQVRRHMLRRRAAPLTSRLLSFQMRRASIPAIARVVHRLRIDADWVVFGHVHRVGPLADDEPSEWAGPDGRMRFANTGSWLYPYWPGGAVLIDDDGVPRALNLLQELDATQLR
jgi:hypothetical protein